ncbi:MAG TPA: hypothetical protein VJ842_05205 [Pyrinomonadaceae bacterium]|nr:hypothetical protein [Pyrinomonadaceae bacterium]
MPTLRDKSRSLAQAIASLRRAAQDVTSATRELTALPETERAAVLAEVSEDLRGLHTQINAEVGAILSPTLASQGDGRTDVNIYDRIRREQRERNATKLDRERRARALGEGL